MRAALNNLGAWRNLYASRGLTVRLHIYKLHILYILDTMNTFLARTASSFLAHYPMGGAI